MNNVGLAGTITSVNFSHEFYGEKYLLCEISVKRLSGTEDEIPVIVSENIKCNLSVGKRIAVEGEFRSFNNGKHNLYVFAQEVRPYNKDMDFNAIRIEGFICKKPEIRETPLGRVITDFMVAVNRTCGRADYIPCVSWGRIAKYAKDIQVGELITLDGRIQSRKYLKGDTKYTTYEVSIGNLKLKQQVM